MTTYNEFRFDITSDRNLEDILKIAFSRHSKAAGWRVEGRRLILSWHNEQDYKNPGKWNAFLAPMEAKEIESTIIAWLKTQDFGHEPDTDGHNRKGFRVYNETYGYVDKDAYAFVAIEPQWITYDK